MRLIEVARKLGMTGQQLRRELSQVDFGVKPTDREIADQVAQGVIRYIATKHGIEVQEDDITGGRQEQESEEAAEEEERTDDEVPLDEVVPREAEQTSRPKQSSAKTDDKKVHVLRKLSLEGVSDEAVEAQRTVQAASSRRPVAAHARKSSASKRSKTTEMQQQIKKKEGVVEIPETITVKEFAEKTGVQVPVVIAHLMKNGIMANINQSIDFDTAAIIADELDVLVKKVQLSASAETLMAGNLSAILKEDDSSQLTHRAPIVTVMGHVDHGKTAILDAIRKTDVAAGEAGGITQSIGASQVEHDGKHVTFLDTPGHEAFTAMRARGAQITDIVVLVIAADEGIKPTTIEAIDHAKDAGVPIVVAINKIDSERADADRVKGELAAHGLQPEEWGGKTPTVLCSAKTGQGIADLLDNILILAEVLELKANANRLGVATVVESHLDSSMGPVASVVINAGTLKVGDVCVCGTTSGRVKSMVGSHGKRCESVGPTAAVRLSGLSSVPETGDILQVVESESEAKKLIAEIAQARERQKKRGIGDLISRLSEGKLTMLKIVLKAESQGSLEAVAAALGKIRTAHGVVSKVIHGAVGAVTESDVMMAAASGGIVFGFDVPLSTHVERIAAECGTEVRLYDVIYELLQDAEGLLEGLIEPEEEEKIMGHLEVRGLFFHKKADQVIGGKVTDGILKRVPFRILRNGEKVGTGRITSLKHVDKDVKEAKEGKEYGLRVDSAFSIAEGDVLEAFVREFRKKKA